MTTDLTTPAAQEAALARGFAETDPRRRPAGQLDGPDLRAEIVRLRGLSMSLATIAAEVGCSRAYVSKVCAEGQGEAHGRGRPRVLPPVDLPEPVLAAMVEALQAGVVNLLAIPGVAECIPVLAKTEAAGEEAMAQTRRVRLGQYIATGEHAAEGPARQLWRARQEGLLRRQVAAA